MVIIDIVINTILGRLTLDPAGMHCPAWDDTFVSSYFILLNSFLLSLVFILLYCIYCIICLCLPEWRINFIII